MELKVEGRNMELKKGWQMKIEEEKEKLIKHYAGFILYLRVAIEATAHHKEGGYEVKIVASVPNDTVVVTKKGERVRPLIIEAFDVLSLQLKEIQRKKRKTKKQAEPVIEGDSFGIIQKVSPQESYGFIATYDDREIYFHENALKNAGIDELAEGDSVIYGESIGDKGPQASWVRVANK
ncbi:MAG: cold shock domain-containing protein [Desulfofustis sp.]|jgi:cold shock CspA family protein/ribosome-associated translation inhibitor RaiA|nr:cold shock domain-containing protein [Desulfofustis sp.]